LLLFSSSESILVSHTLGLLDNLEKELNVYSTRLREWYGWHFPELARLVSRHQDYARVCKLLRQRSNIETVDLSEILDAATKEQVVMAAKGSMGSEIEDEDMLHVVQLAKQVIELFRYWYDF
jgi:nucleolar protein 58